MNFSNLRATKKSPTSKTEPTKLQKKTPFELLYSLEKFIIFLRQLVNTFELVKDWCLRELASRRVGVI